MPPAFPTLQERVRIFNLGTPTPMHIGTHELVNELWRELEKRLENHVEDSGQTNAVRSSTAARALSLDPVLIGELWAAVKETRDEASNRELEAQHTERRMDSLLARMKLAGMADHLPTFEEVQAAWHADGYLEKIEGKSTIAAAVADRPADPGAE